ncbi:hypothetical protein [Rhodopirellula bahusiensis]|uniref:Uncharacterized protein n=1 Tax=Rhodopirellula bahusiensis TaxID=2014065 RepID=A0A2G1VYT4_9BACT|nr:hypothetical protein [Rhodopirellula bahusiensis]PHQ31579.1 hypothetical protein CEE69_30315 [Rhodopirellula bahusiensis]
MLISGVRESWGMMMFAVYQLKSPNFQPLLFVLQKTNPYETPSDSGARVSSPPEPSTWRRNFVSLSAIVSIYCLIAAVFALSRQSLPPPIVYPLSAAAFCCSAWANFQLGPRIGWGLGGLPVVFILVIGWAVAYMVASMMGAGVVYWFLDPDRLLH